MLTIGVDAADQLRKMKVPVLGDRAELVPEDVFQTDTCFVTADDERALYHPRLEMTVADPPRGSFQRNVVAGSLRRIWSRAICVIVFWHWQLAPAACFQFRQLRRQPSTRIHGII